MTRRRAVGAGGYVTKAFVLVQILIVFVPLSVIVVWAFASNWPWPDLLPSGFSLRGIEQVLLDGRGTGLSIMLSSVGIALACAVLTTAVAVMAARAVVCYSWRGRNAFSFALMIPFLIPATVFAMGVQVLFIKAGIARTVFGVVLAHSIVALPYACTIMVEVTRAVGTRLEDAAATLGARPGARLVHITLPALLPGILSSLSMSYILSFSQYFLTLLIGGGAVKTFAVTMFPYLGGGDRTVAAAYGIVFIAVTLAVFLLFEWLLKRFGMREEKQLFS